MRAKKTTGSSLRDSINELTEKLIEELMEEKLTPTEKLAFLKALLPYSVGRLPNAAVNYKVYGSVNVAGNNNSTAVGSGQPTSARIIEPTKDGGIEEGEWMNIVGL